MTADTSAAAAAAPTAAVLDSLSSTVRSRCAAAPRVSLAAEVGMLVSADAIAAGMAAMVGVRAALGDGGRTGYPWYALVLAFSGGWLITMALAGAYDPRRLATGRATQRALHAGAWLAGIAALTSFALHLQIAPAFLATAFPAAMALTLLVRSVHRTRLRRRLARGAVIDRVLLVGPRTYSHRLTTHMNGRSTGYRVVGMRSSLPEITGDDPERIHRETRSHLRELVDDARRRGATCIALSGPEVLGGVGIHRLSWEVEGTGISLMVAPNIADIAGPRIIVHPIAGLPALLINEPSHSRRHRIVKDCLDRSAAAILLLLTGPLMGAAAVAILVREGRPLLDRSVRVGRDGRQFRMSRFRTSPAADCDDHTGSGVAFAPVTLLENPLITPLGRFLRRYSVDELPQLWNVLTGSMSLVGPRPQPASDAERPEYDAHRRLLVKPGITGLWQVGGRSNLSWEEWLRLDLHYIDNWSLRTDVWVLWRTVSALLHPRGAY